MREGERYGWMSFAHDAVLISECACYTTLAGGGSSAGRGARYRHPKHHCANRGYAYRYDARCSAFFASPVPAWMGKEGWAATRRRLGALGTKLATTTHSRAGYSHPTTGPRARAHMCRELARCKMSCSAQPPAWCVVCIVRTVRRRRMRSYRAFTYRFFVLLHTP